MKRNWVLFLLAVAVVAGTQVAAAQGQTATQTVTFQIGAINVISVSGDPGTLTIDSENEVAIDASTTYSITTNEDGRKITGVVDANLPDGVTLTISLAAPAGATSAGDVALSTTAADLVTGTSRVAEAGLRITYRLSATMKAGAQRDSRTVTLTITPAT